LYKLNRNILIENTVIHKMVVLIFKNNNIKELKIYLKIEN